MLEGAIRFALYGESLMHGSRHETSAHHRLQWLKVPPERVLPLLTLGHLDEARVGNDELGTRMCLNKFR